jgi:hypothetical protein
MNKLITLTAVLALASCNSYSVNLPVIAKHTKERNHPSGDDWKETFFGKGVGISGINDNGLGANATYVKENSLRHEAIYLTGEYMTPIYTWKLSTVSVGGSLGVATGYPSKKAGRSETDFVPWGSINGQVEREGYFTRISLVPTSVAGATFILNIGYKF